MYQMGRIYAEAMPIYCVKDSASRILNSLAMTPADGQTALGPALVFCYGMASALQMPLHQMYLYILFSNIITDGSSNIGFGDT
jgi:hypothetical protein